MSLLDSIPKLGVKSMRFFGEKLGFEAIDRKAVDPAIQGTVEYQMARAKEATWMTKLL